MIICKFNARLTQNLTPVHPIVITAFQNIKIVLVSVCQRVDVVHRMLRTVQCWFTTDCLLCCCV